MNYIKQYIDKPLKTKILVSMLISTFIIGLICNFFYANSPKHTINISKFQWQLKAKEELGEKTIYKLKDIIIHSSVDSLANYPFGNEEINYFVFSNNVLVFWSDNNLEISKEQELPSPNWRLAQLPNATCLRKTISFGTTKILSLIKLKNNFPYENDQLINAFAKGFSLDKQIQIFAGNKTDKYAIEDQNNSYLFSLSESKTTVYNETWAIIGLIAFSLSFLIFFVIYVNFPILIHFKTLNIKTFLLISGLVGISLGLLLYFNIPSLLFVNKHFTPFQYASNPFLSSISHLTVLTAYLISTICLLRFYTKTHLAKFWVSKALIQISAVLYFVLIFYLLRGLIYHSSIQLSILDFKDFTGFSIWVHLLILIWGIGLAFLFFKVHELKVSKIKNYILFDSIMAVVLYCSCHYISPTDSLRLVVSFIVVWSALYCYFMFQTKKRIYTFTAVGLFAFSLFVVLNSVIISNDKKFEKYKILAQNIYINGSSGNDQMADSYLEELDIKINADKKIGKFLNLKDSILLANEYLNKTYFRGFWNKYDMRLNIAKKNSAIYNEYADFIAKSGTQIKQTHFFNVPSNENNMTYIGLFHVQTTTADSLCFFMEFYPRKNFKSYSFPNLLISNGANIQSHLNISVAKYENGRLVYSSGKREYPASPSWIAANKSDFYETISENHKSYIYKPNKNTCIVITEQVTSQVITDLLYFAYTYLAYFTLCCSLIWIYALARNKWKYRLGLIAKFQLAFIALLIISFIGIFFVSVNFIEKKYREQQIANLENKKGYIQKALQERYYWNQDLNAQNSQALNFDLQDLSYNYHTDIHVYDNSGQLIGSSQPIIFNKNLISTRISPAPFFGQNSNVNQSEHIGKLNYLSGYCDFYNGDYLQMGFIAVPQFFSQDEIKAEIESFISVIVHIYLIIILLAIFLSLFIGKQLSAPLIMLENKLKEMRLGRRNEKIDYTLKDEIGQLVLQYNRTVDELEQSARLLAQSERESAWKLMARQVAHEINNPLTPMKLTIQQLQRTKNMENADFDTYFKKSTSMLIEQIDNLSRIAGTFSNFARMPEANFNKFDIADRLSSVVQLFSNNNEHVEIEYNGADNSVYVFADPEQMVQVFNNLLKNAIQAIPDNRNGIINLHLQQKDGQVIIEVSDNGSGIDMTLRDKLFVPNFTTKSTGMGLGLAISKNIIEISGGTISFDSNENEGTTFRITLPEAN